MRLGVVERGHRIPQKLQLAMIRVVTRRRAVDIIRTVMYRPEFFGRPMNEWTQRVMRGPSDWAVWERELFAAFTSLQPVCLLNQSARRGRVESVGRRSTCRLSAGGLADRAC